ncbi:MAG: hypothetical protein FWE88_05060 [Phycisphaerae bacterium]|nr:hypothetical protein [Phycisphaerae bacterium]
MLKLRPTRADTTVGSHLHYDVTTRGSSIYSSAPAGHRYRFAVFLLALMALVCMGYFASTSMSQAQFSLTDVIPLGFEGYDPDWASSGKID